MLNALKQVRTVTHHTSTEQRKDNSMLLHALPPAAAELLTQKLEQADAERFKAGAFLGLPLNTEAHILTPHSADFTFLVRFLCFLGARSHRYDESQSSSSGPPFAVVLFNR